MKTILPAPARLAAAFLAAALSVSLAHAQERRERREREHERERFQTPHWVLDDRFHHNHYYPAVGYAVDVLPSGNVVVNFRSGRFWFHSGVWFQQAGPRYVVVRPPVGVLVPVLPPAYATVLHRRRAVLLRQRCLLRPAARWLCRRRAADDGEPESAAPGARGRQHRTAEFPGDLVLLRLREGVLSPRCRVQGGLAKRSGDPAASALIVRAIGEREA